MPAGGKKNGKKKEKSFIDSIGSAFSEAAASGLLGEKAKVTEQTKRKRRKKKKKGM